MPCFSWRLAPACTHLFSGWQELAGKASCPLLLLTRDCPGARAGAGCSCGSCHSPHETAGSSSRLGKLLSRVGGRSKEGKGRGGLVPMVLVPIASLLLPFQCASSCSDLREPLACCCCPQLHAAVLSGGACCISFPSCPGDWLPAAAVFERVCSWPPGPRAALGRWLWSPPQGRVEWDRCGPRVCSPQPELGLCYQLTG